MGILHAGLKFANKLCAVFNRRILLVPIPAYGDTKNKIMLNIGAGNWREKGWTNLDFPSEWYKKAQVSNFTPFDIRSDNIPYPDNSVDLIYCSHVIEHIENVHIERFFSECHRVLKSRGGIRLTCPDAEFLYNVAKHDTDYWEFLRNWSYKFCTGHETIRGVDYLVGETATPKMLQHIHSINREDYMPCFESMDMYDFFEHMTGDLVFQEKFPFHHINYWTFDKIKRFLVSAGFRPERIIHSKWSASIHKHMADIGKFDTTYPVMSLYVDAVK